MTAHENLRYELSVTQDDTILLARDDLERLVAEYDELVEELEELYPIDEFQCRGVVDVPIQGELL